MSRQLTAMVLFAALAGAVIACAGAASAPNAAPAGGAPQDRLSQPQAGQEQPQSGQGNPTGQQPQQPLASPGTTLIVHSGTMDIDVSDLQATVEQANAAIAGLGGQVDSSNQQNSTDKQVASVTYRIPAERWDDALAALRGLGQKVVSETTNSQDVTAQVVDLDARISNLQASEAALQGIMAKATTITDVLKVQDELTAVRGDIESMTAQRDHFANQAALGTLTVNFEVPTVQTNVASQGWDLGHEVDSAVAALVRLGQGSASVLIWLLVVVLPVAIVLSVVVFIAYRVRRRWLRSRPERVPPPPSWGPPPPAAPTAPHSPNTEPSA